jgi:hypothetical protein
MKILFFFLWYFSFCKMTGPGAMYWKICCWLYCTKRAFSKYSSISNSTHTFKVIFVIYCCFLHTCVVVDRRQIFTEINYFPICLFYSCHVCKVYIYTEYSAFISITTLLCVQNVMQSSKRININIDWTLERSISITFYIRTWVIEVLAYTTLWHIEDYSHV